MDQIQFPPITSDLKPCNAVACILHTKDFRILMNLRDNKKNIFYSNHWGLFGGGVEKGETYLDAIKREIYEETNLKINNFDFFSECILDFSMFSQNLKVVRKYYKSLISEEDLKNIVLLEGQKWSVFNYSELYKLNICPYDKFVLDQFNAFKNFNS